MKFLVQKLTSEGYVPIESFDDEASATDEALCQSEAKGQKLSVFHVSCFDDSDAPPTMSIAINGMLFVPVNVLDKMLPHKEDPSVSLMRTLKGLDENITFFFIEPDDDDDLPITPGVEL